MMKVKIKETGEIREVTRNVAFGLIDSGQGFLVTNEKPQVYEHREMRPARRSKYKTK